MASKFVNGLIGAVGGFGKALSDNAEAQRQRAILELQREWQVEDRDLAAEEIAGTFTDAEGNVIPYDRRGGVLPSMGQSLPETDLQKVWSEEAGNYVMVPKTEAHNYPLEDPNYLQARNRPPQAGVSNVMAPYVSEYLSGADPEKRAGAVEGYLRNQGLGGATGLSVDQQRLWNTVIERHTSTDTLDDNFGRPDYTAAAREFHAMGAPDLGQMADPTFIPPAPPSPQLSRSPQLTPPGQQPRQAPLNPVEQGANEILGGVLPSSGADAAAPSGPVPVPPELMDLPEDTQVRWRNDDGTPGRIYVRRGNQLVPVP
jgi:hypothetical protein